MSQFPVARAAETNCSVTECVQAYVGVRVTSTGNCFLDNPRLSAPQISSC